MNVLVCVDANYVLPLFAMLRSLSRHASGRDVSLYVVGTGLDDAAVGRLKRLGSRAFRSLEYRAVSLDAVQHLPVQRWISHAAYLKLLAPDLLPVDAGRVIVLDADLIVRTDPRPLWETGMGDRLLMAVQDYGCPYVSSSFGIKSYSRFGFAADAPYFNSGVMLIDLARWRAEKVAERSLHYLATEGHNLRCHDQEALNVVAGNRWGALDPRWNQMPHVYWSDSLPDSPHKEQLLAQRQGIVATPHIIHFAARQKPWLPGCTHPARELFLREFRSSGYFSLPAYLRWRRSLKRAGRAGVTVATPPEAASAEAAAKNRQRYRAVGLTGVSVGRQNVWLHSPRSGVSRVVPAAMVQLLTACDSFRTLDDHAGRISEAATARRSRVPAGTPGAPPPLTPEVVQGFRRQLEDFVRDGFLIPETQLFTSVGDTNAGAGLTDQPSVRVTMLGIPTRDRPELLRRALFSYADNLDRNGRDAGVLIVDDSREPDSVTYNAESAIEAEERSGVAVTVVDRRWRLDYARRLAVESGVPGKIVEFALMGDDRCSVSHGAARNTLQLLSAGKALVQVDDDTVCRIVEVATRPESLYEDTAGAGSQFWYLLGEEAPENTVRVEADFLGLHEALLGSSRRKLQRLLDGGRLGADIVDLPPDSTSAADEYEGGSEVPVGIGVTLGGGIGDSGLRNSWSRLTSRGPSFDRLVMDEAGYRQRLTTRRVLRASAIATVSASPLCVAMNLGLDNRRILPPFMPVQRREDGIFMAVLQRCTPFLWSGHLTHAVAHHPVGRVTHEQLHFDLVGREYHVNDLLEWILTGPPGGVRSTDPSRSLIATGEFLTELSRLPLADFEVQLRIAGARALNMEIGTVERRLDEVSGPPLWIRDARRYAAALRYALTLPDFIVPRDLQGRPEERLAVARSLFGRYGELLQCWPELLRAAATLEADQEVTGTAQLQSTVHM